VVNITRLINYKDVIYFIHSYTVMLKDVPFVYYFNLVQFYLWCQTFN